MEHACCKKYVIEFNGLPGTGKTTIANYVESLLKDSGLDISREYYKRQKHKNNRTLLVSAKHLLLITKLFLLSLFICPLRKRVNGIVAFAKYIRMYDDYSKRDGGSILITDEGIIQAISSIYHRDRIKNKRIINVLLRIINNNGLSIVRIDCTSNVALSSSRIIERGLTGARLDSLGYQERIEALATQSFNFGVIRERASNLLSWDCINVDTSLRPEVNAQVICDVFNSMVGNEI